MSISLGANGGSYSYPQENDPAGWGDDATNWASAVSAALSNIGLGGTVNPKALIDMTVTNSKGFLPPKLTTAERNAIATPPAGLVIYNTTTSQLEVYTGSSWFSVASNIDGNLTVTGNATVNGNSTLNGTLTVTGATSLQSVTSTGSTVNGVLSVTGNTTLVNVTGANITSTGTILAASGTSGSPSVASSGDTDTGIYWSAANTLAIQTGGADRAVIDSNGITADFPSWNLVDQKAASAGGGTFTSGAWRTRDLNTTIGSNTITGSSVTSNQFILPAGTYRIFVNAPAFGVSRHKAKLRNITDSSDTLIGSSEYCSSAQHAQTNSNIIGKFTIGAQKTFEIQHRCDSTMSSIGYGVESGFSVVEIYTQVWLWKLA